MTEPELTSCGVLVVRGDPIDCFLLMKHPKRWDLPKGHVDPGETELECAFRELEEETGIRRSEVDLDPDFRFSLRYEVQYKRTGERKRLKELIIFLGKLHVDRDIVLTEHEGYKWVKWNPPHSIQSNTIDPLLASLAEFLDRRNSGPG